MKYIYLIRHSSPFVEIENYNDYKNVLWDEYNKNRILSVGGEEKAKKLCDIKELKNIKNIYSSNSFRAIGTAKYLSELNNTKIKLDDRINERNLGVKYISDLPDDYIKHSFNDKNFKVYDGETLNDVDSRFNDFIKNILKENDKTILVIHGIILLSFLQNNCEFEYNENKILVKHNNEVIIEGNPKSPGVYKVVYNDDNKIIQISNIN